MERKPLTKTSIQKLTFDADKPARQVHFDSKLAGFGVRVHRSGRKAYVLQYGSRDRRRLLVLAPCTTGDDVDKVRDRAQALIRKQQSDGIDPLNEKRKAQAGTVAAVVTSYIDARTPHWSGG